MLEKYNYQKQVALDFIDTVVSDLDNDRFSDITSFTVSYLIDEYEEDHRVIHLTWLENKSSRDEYEKKAKDYVKDNIPLALKAWGQYRPNDDFDDYKWGYTEIDNVIRMYIANEIIPLFVNRLNVMLKMHSLYKDEQLTWCEYFDAGTWFLKAMEKEIEERFKGISEN